MKLPVQIKLLLIAVVLLILYSVASRVYKGTTSFYNTSKNYEFTYVQLTQQQITTFDNNYLIFKDKCTIAELNKETFVVVTQIIFENRADGMNVAWKWMQENQQVPYTEFTKFYSDLSAFVRERYDENNAIELQKQNIAKNQNQLLATFPGVIYNYFLKMPKLTYTEGFITEDTRILFNKPQ